MMNSDERRQRRRIHVSDSGSDISDSSSEIDQLGNLRDFIDDVSSETASVDNDDSISEVSDSVSDMSNASVSNDDSISEVSDSDSYTGNDVDTVLRKLAAETDLAHVRVNDTIYVWRICIGPRLSWSLARPTGSYDKILVPLVCRIFGVEPRDNAEQIRGSDGRLRSWFDGFDLVEIGVDNDDAQKLHCLCTQNKEKLGGIRYKCFVRHRYTRVVLTLGMCCTMHLLGFNHLSMLNDYVPKKEYNYRIIHTIIDSAKKMGIHTSNTLSLA